MNHPVALISRTAFGLGMFVWAILCAGCAQRATSEGPGALAAPDFEARPTNLKSVPFQGISLPVADQGPRNYAGAVVSGFDHNPIGASLAAIHATVRISVAADSQWVTIAQQMLAPGLGRDAWAVARAQISVTGPATADGLTIAGYRIVSYIPAAADIDIYAVQADRSITRNRANVVWQRGDWKLLLLTQPQSSPVTTVAALPDELIALPRQ
ncbi:hypothetical protein GFY24_37000 [Nocardia sp. SYP-A9097]|uniref:hypothetical protein n=1 Tax=Nocardia sp. SYP-A9097 TaxID=2663237 RepID=UPI00129BB652|nr:hypothetical protein [Nocardia sp. SYP-A9097]MRH92954.1 hypothetical protein [Nocardia sp. SYP-A9097]